MHAFRCRWGDHLYAKGEYDAAMSQYLETLTFLEPSYVIRRFLDAQRIHSLTLYLEQLHDKVRLATARRKYRSAPRNLLYLHFVCLHAQKQR